MTSRAETASPTRRLFLAAADGDIGGIRAASAEGACLDGGSEEFILLKRDFGPSRIIDSPLEGAIAVNNLAAAAYLIDAGADPDGNGPRGGGPGFGWPLHRACVLEREDSARLLVERGASPRAPCLSGHNRDQLARWGLLDAPR